jgi:predicted lipoprotein
MEDAPPNSNAAQRRPTRARRLRRALAWSVPVALAWVVFPPIHIRAMHGHSAVAASLKAGFDARAFATRFWSDKLLPAAARATDVTTLLNALALDSASAELRYGKRAGLGSKTYYLVNGEARVSAVSAEGLRLTMSAPGRPATSPVTLLTAPVFGNALREATGLLQAQDFTSFDFNAIGAELNHLVESTVQPRLRKGGAVGARLRFSGCAELEASSLSAASSAAQRAAPPPALLIIPINVEFLP